MYAILIFEDLIAILLLVLLSGRGGELGTTLAKLAGFLVALMVGGLLVVIRHHSNIRRLLAGTEPRL